MGERKANLTIRFSVDLRERLEKLAKRQNRSLGNMIETLLQQAVTDAGKPTEPQNAQAAEEDLSTEEQAIRTLETLSGHGDLMRLAHPAKNPPAAR